MAARGQKEFLREYKVHIKRNKFYLNDICLSLLIYRKAIICKIKIRIQSISNTRRIEQYIVLNMFCNAVLGAGLIKARLKGDWKFFFFKFLHFKSHF